ncbi:probable LRR receptor-like serine/threonine-protein kinase At3g47570 isoform X1 [Trifolium pratense]|uniref:probable LRR receptor-like serine/threonine-protein kinase At3g47570 isoform X1 n=1 Tax=Trifolium pratense TaxID=57577 RepID=UPI001E6935BE|nr:probable LRR receptor-like serine/threonine-protein kinase At3g47570 isoform X1 [Trifolium pratense]
MKSFSFLSVSPTLLYLHLLFLFTLTDHFVAVPAILGNQTDHLALLKFKESISSDPYKSLESWNSSIHFCKWRGITCNPMHQRVIGLNLGGYQVHGSLSPYIGNLTFLKNLTLQNNSFHGEIPQELGQLLQLQKLHISNNSFVGKIPTNLTYCSNLKELYLSRNNLIGKIPIEIASLKNLQRMTVSNNKLTGGIPSFIGNLSFITHLSFGRNNFEGDIPQAICRLKTLTILHVGENNLSGTPPFCVYNITSLTIFYMAFNNFHGSLPPNMFHNLPNIQEFGISGNQFSGPIPTSINASSSINYLDISDNNFVGQVPSLGKLKDLYHLNLELNNLGNNSAKDLEFLKSLTNCTKLNVVSIYHNYFGGILPNSIGNLSTELNLLYLDANMISGKIPAELGRLVGLISLSLESNQFEGIIPTTFEKFQNLQMLRLSINKLSGNIPHFICNLSQLYFLDLYYNMFHGNIPSSIGNCQKLQFLDLSQNKLRGTVPLEVFNLFSLSTRLDLSGNSLSGSLPREVGMLKHVFWLDVSENHLSGDIPETIGECISLEHLSLQGNYFNGTIPSSFVSLKGLRYLDLSRNKLYGPIPDVMQNISSLEYLNVSFNMLEGEVPTNGVFGNATQVAIIGNNKLCGGIAQLHLPPCDIKRRKHTKHHKFKLITLIICVVSFLLVLSFIITIYWIRKINRKRSFDSPTIDQLAKISYHDLHRGTDGFSPTNLIGSGSFGSVYKANLVSEDHVVAVKVLNLQKKGAHKSFIIECNALKNVRHRNLVKILTCCSSTDYKGQEFKALVFDYMKNGSLEQWLHPREENGEHPRTLDLNQRLNTIIDVASALHYLHHECEQLILHCDLKPSNVLIDNDMVSHVSDFGISRLISAIDGTSQMDNSTIEIKGTVGYAPPEYGMGSEVSTCGDMYSFGILVLEMLTGRRPIDETFEDGQNLHNFVSISFPDNLIKVLDPHLVSGDAKVVIEDGNSENLITSVEEWLVSLFKIGLVCSMESPKERLNIVDVNRELSIIKKVFLAGPHTQTKFLRSSVEKEVYSA